MNKREKLLAKAQANPVGLSFGDLETLLAQCGWVFKRQIGSHRHWMSPSGRLVPFQPDGGKAKAYQVKQFLRILENGDA